MQVEFINTPYMNGQLKDNRFVQDIDAEIRQMKDDGTKEAGYMTYLMKLDEEREEGREESRTEIIANMLEAHLDPKMIEKLCGTTAERIRQVASQRGLAVDC